MKRWRTTLVLLALFGALLAYVILVEGKREPPPEPGATPSPTPASLLDVAREEVYALHVHAGEQEVRLERTADGWRVARPEDAPADSFALSWPIDELRQLAAKRIVAQEVADLAEFGLDPVTLTAVIETAGGEVELHVGRETPDSTAYYVQRAGDPRLYIVERYKIEPLFDWIAQPPFQPTPTPVAE